MIGSRPPDLHLPRVEPFPEGVARPFWSVMITVYNRTAYLAAALESVLAQDPGPEEMEIVVVDDCSPDVDVEPIIRAVGKGRVSLHRRPTNGGLSSTWTECVRRARGTWIHILHDDDMVLPGFYQRLREGVEGRADVGAAFSRQIFMGEDGTWLSFSPLERRTPGVLEGWVDRIAVRQRIQCPSIVVRRDVYERLGGFHPGLVFALDWEMWKRVAASYPVWYDPQPLACYRLHETSETKRLQSLGRTISDMVECIELSRRYLPPGRAGKLTRLARRHYASVVLRLGWNDLSNGRAGSAAGRVWTALSISQSPRIQLVGLRFLAAVAVRVAWWKVKPMVRLAGRVSRRLSGRMAHSRRNAVAVAETKIRGAQ